MPENKDAVLRRVQKLLAIANDERANPAEAAAAAQQAEKIMRKFQIEHADVVRRELESEANFSTADCTVIMKRDLKGAGAHVPKKVPTWGQWLSVAVARLFDAQVRIAHAERGAAVRFFGYASDVQVASWTFDYLVGCVIAGIRRYQSAEPRTKAESESFRRGFVLQVIAMLNQMSETKAREMSQASSSRELVVAKAAAVALHFGEAKYVTRQSKARVLGDAYHAGREEGKKVEVRQGVRHDGSAGQLRIEL